METRGSRLTGGRGPRSAAAASAGPGRQAGRWARRARCLRGCPRPAPARRHFLARPALPRQASRQRPPLALPLRPGRGGGRGHGQAGPAVAAGAAAAAGARARAETAAASPPGPLSAGPGVGRGQGPGPGRGRRAAPGPDAPARTNLCAPGAPARPAGPAPSAPPARPASCSAALPHLLGPLHPAHRRCSAACAHVLRKRQAHLRGLREAPT